MLGAGVLRQVDQVGERGAGGQLRQQGRGRLGRQATQLQRDLGDPVGREHARAAAIGDDGQVAAHRAVARGQALGGREQRHEGLHAHGPGAAQGRIEHIVAADDGAAVRLRGLVARPLAPRLEDDHRLGGGRRAQRAHEAAGVVDALHVDDDAVRLAVSRQEVQHVGDVERRVWAQRHHGREAHGVVGRPVEHGRGQRARLRHQRQAAAARQGAGHTGIELRRRALDTQAVGAQQVHIGLLRNLVQHLGLLGRDAGREHHHGVTVHAAGELDGRRDVFERQRDDRQVRLGRGQVGQRAAGRADVDEAVGAGEALGPQGRVQQAGLLGQLLGVVGRSGKDRNRGRGEEGSEEMLVHGNQSAPMRERTWAAVLRARALRA